MRQASTVGARASPVPVGPSDTGALETSRLLELADLYRIPFWVLAKAGYSFAPISLHFRLVTLQGTLDAMHSRHRNMLINRLEGYLGEMSRRELRHIAVHHFQSRTKDRFVTIWPQVRDLAGVEKVPIEGLPYLDQALQRGKGVILATGHFGYPRMIKPILRSHGRRVLVVAAGPAATLDRDSRLTRLGSLVHTRILHLPTASQLDERWQRAAGTDLEAGLNVRPHLAALERNETLVILADGRSAQTFQRLPVGGIDVYFAPGVITLARDTGAAVLPAFVVDDPERKGISSLQLIIHPPLELEFTEDRNADVAENLRRFARVYGQQMRTHPHNWLWGWVRDGVFERPEPRRDRGAREAKMQLGSTRRRDAQTHPHHRTRDGAFGRPH